MRLIYMLWLFTIGSKENDPVYQFVNRLVGEWLRHIDSMDSSRLKEEFCIVNPVAFVQVVGVLKDNYERVGLKERLVDASSEPSGEL